MVNIVTILIKQIIKDNPPPLGVGCVCELRLFGRSRQFNLILYSHNNFVNINAMINKEKQIEIIKIGALLTSYIYKVYYTENMDLISNEIYMSLHKSSRDDVLFNFDLSFEENAEDLVRRRKVRKMLEDRLEFKKLKT